MKKEVWEVVIQSRGDDFNSIEIYHVFASSAGMAEKHVLDLARKDNLISKPYCSSVKFLFYIR